MFYSTEYPSPVGKLSLCCDGEKLVGLWLAGQKYFGGTISGEMIPCAQLPIFGQVRDWLDRYFAGQQPVPEELPLAPIGGEFRQKVWRILCGIPYGQVTTYGDIAKELAGSHRSAQAVGGAVGHNPISIIIPCHRVVGSKGSLTGYAGGMEKKTWLLRHEGVDLTELFIPKAK